MIKRVRLRNYGPFEDAELSLGPLTVLVGPNASGKSIAIKSLERLRKGFPKSLVRNGADPRTASAEVEDSSGKSWTSILPREHQIRALFPQDFPETRLVALQPPTLREASYIDSDQPLVETDGYGLATALAYMKLSNSDGFAAIEKRTRAIVPTFESLRFKRSKVASEGPRTIYGDELVFDMKGASGLPPSAVSDGTLLTLGLLTMTMQYSAVDREFLFLIDELERGLHPKALGELIAQLRRLTRESEVQILATSHSPYLVDWLQPDEVRLTGLLDDGTATIRKLTDHPDFERWKEEMSPGELWSTVGEDWIQ